MNLATLVTCCRFLKQRVNCTKLCRRSLNEFIVWYSASLQKEYVHVLRIQFLGFVKFGAQVATFKWLRLLWSSLRFHPLQERLFFSFLRHALHPLLQFHSLQLLESTISHCTNKFMLNHRFTTARMSDSSLRSELMTSCRYTIYSKEQLITLRMKV